MRHRASVKFWRFYADLPAEAQRQADVAYALLRADGRHPSLQFKKVRRFWSARVGIHYRAVAVEQGGDMVWFWIGHHSEYDHLIGGR